MFFNKEDKKDDLAKVAALLIHMAKIDQEFSLQEEEIIKKTLIKIGANNENILKIMENGKQMESDSIQILNFTKEVKSMNESDKIKIIESLWEIIYSDKKADIYETNLMRRLAGLLYIDSKIMGDIKERIKIKSLK
tara:strand:+ start:1194 stop:1601 length:408 start_codon:yes stop_codon:yes gene_type:complete